MAHIHAVAPNTLTSVPSLEKGQLGTDGLDFLTALLGLQAGQNLEGDLTELVKSLGDFKLDTLESGQDAALPIVAEKALLSGLASFQPTLANQPLLEMPQVAVAPKAAPEAKVSDALFVPTAPTLSNMPAVQALLNTPVEELEPQQLKQVVSTFWGEAKEAKDIQSVKFDELHSSPQSDSVQHHLLKAFAGEKPVVEMGKAVEKRPEIFSVREEAANTPVLASVPEAIEKPNTKEPKAQGMEGIPDTLPMAPSSVMESADSVLKTESV
jgi:hypothetical protein